jgi:hypothetical protein
VRDDSLVNFFTSIILFMSAGPLFDVYLIGARDSSPSAQMRIVSVVAARYRLSAPDVAEALQRGPDGRCRVAQRLSSQDAQVLIDALDTLGVIGRLSPAGVPLGTHGPSHDEGLAIASGKDRRITLKSADAFTPLVVDLADTGDFAQPGPDGRTGVRGPDTVRCPIHGLAYNRRTASGCVRCMAPARAQAKQMQAKHLEDGFPVPVSARAATDRGSPPAWLSTPARRAFLGLAVALLLGFLPAVIYARTSVRNEISALRARQVEISTAPAERAAVAQAQFDDLDAAVNAVQRAGAGKTLLIWLAVTAATGAAWSRLFSG